MPTKRTKLFAHRFQRGERQRLHGADEHPHDQINDVIENGLHSHRKVSFLGTAIVAEIEDLREERFSRGGRHLLTQPEGHASRDDRFSQFSTKGGTIGPVFC